MTDPREVTVDALERQYPWIRWRTPVRVTSADASKRYGCRVCIAIRGLTGDEVEALPETRGEWEKHFVEVHIAGGTG